jgi:hypothetical protein
VLLRNLQHQYTLGKQYKRVQTEKHYFREGHLQKKCFQSGKVAHKKLQHIKYGRFITKEAEDIFNTNTILTPSHNWPFILLLLMLLLLLLLPLFEHTPPVQWQDWPAMSRYTVYDTPLGPAAADHVVRAGVYPGVCLSSGFWGVSVVYPGMYPGCIVGVSGVYPGGVSVVYKGVYLGCIQVVSLGLTIKTPTGRQ